jgi:hypothetical protein
MRGAENMDWKEAAMSGGAVAVLVEVCLFVVGRSDIVRERRERRTRELALEAIRESDEFVNSGEQKIINETMQRDISEVKATGVRIEGKLDTLSNILLRRGDR